MTESRWLTRMPVYDLETGRIVGRVRRLIVDADERRIVGLLLAGRLGKEAHCLPFRDLHAIGEHAVTVRGTDAIAPLSELPEMQEVLRSRRRLYHAPILTEGGRFLGDVDEFTVNPRSGRIETLLLSGGLIRDLVRGQGVLPAHLILTVGEDALIVRDQAVALLEPRPREAPERRTARREHDTIGGPPDGRDPREGPPSRPMTAGQRLRAVFTGWRSRRPPAGTTPADAGGAAAADVPIAGAAPGAVSSCAETHGAEPAGTGPPGPVEADSGTAVRAPADHPTSAGKAMGNRPEEIEAGHSQGLT